MGSSSLGELALGRSSSSEPMQVIELVTVFVPKAAGDFIVVQAQTPSGTTTRARQGTL